MNDIQRGKMVRRIRDEHGLKLEDLADAEISTSTISRIEKGEPSKKIDYLLAKFGTTLSKVEKRYHDEIEHIEQITRYHIGTSEGITDLLGSHSPTLATRSIGQLDTLVKSCHPYYPKLLFLKGKQTFKMGDRKQAKAHYLDAIKAISESHESDNQNVKSCSYNDLGYISYLDNGMEQALSDIQRGLKSFQQDGEESHIRHTLLCNQALYYEKLGMFDESTQTINILWDEYNLIQKAFTKGQMHVLQARLDKRNKLYDSAKKHLNEGLVIARINKLKGIGFTILATFGNLFRETGKLDIAEDCLLSAIGVADHLDHADIERTIIDTRLELSLVYLEMDQPEKAHENILLAIKLAEQFDDALRLVRGLVVQSDLSTQQNSNGVAIVLLKKARRLAYEHHFKAQLVVILQKLALLTKEESPNEYQNIIMERFDIENEITQEV